MFYPFPRPLPNRTGMNSSSSSVHEAGGSAAKPDRRSCSSDPRKAPPTNFRQRESQFVNKNGRRHHTYDSEKAPYPLSYDRTVLELEGIAQRYLQCVIQNPSFVRFPEGPPTKCLDLGCGTGMWIIDAAKEWSESHFVGFDLVNVQVPLSLLENSISERITWIYGNFLTTKLPFDDDEFDYVRMRGIAKAVPENKWGVLFEEVNRILRPEGAVEVMEDDIIFPKLPRWFTSPFRHKSRRTVPNPLNESPQDSETPSLKKPRYTLAHDHALLESLYNSVFEHRFINLRPTAVLPIYFTMYFSHTYLSPLVHYFMPPVAPPRPLPKPVSNSYAKAVERGIPAVSQESTFHRSTSLSFSSIASSTTTTTSTTESSIMSLFTDGSREDSRIMSTSSLLDNASEDASTPTPTPQPSKIFNKEPTRRRTLGFRSPARLYYMDSTGSTEFEQDSLERRLHELSERCLAMQLYYTYQGILACQEAMWEELDDRIRNKKEDLVDFGWEDDEELQELEGRKRFEKLIERYQTDMEARIALWCSCIEAGWTPPLRDPLSPPELIEEERLRRDMLEAQKNILEEDLYAVSRAMRVLVGYKSALDS